MDKLSAERRSANMREIRSKNTAPELLLRRMLHRLGYRFRLHRKDLPGKPDLVFPSRRKAIFVHGCFWHQHPACREGRVRPATTYQRGELPRSSYSCEAAAALPRRGASPMTLRTRTPPWSATVTTSPHLTSRPGAATRTPLTRTCPTMASDAAALRVRTIRAFHSHRSIRCRSGDTTQSPQRRSLAFASSWALRAASLANGEFGSICFSRSRTGA